MRSAEVPKDALKAGQPAPPETRRPDASPAADNLSAREYCIIDLYDSAGHWIDSIVRQGDCDSVTLDLRMLATLLADQHFPIMLIRHSHPSGVTEPSSGDIAATRSIATLGRLLGVRLYDHVIEAGDARFSFRAAGLL